MALLAASGAMPPPQPLPPVDAPPAALHTRRMFVRLDSKGDAPPVVSYKKLCREFEDAARGRTGTGSGAKGRATAAPENAGAEAEQPEDADAPSDDGESSDEEEDDDAPEDDADGSQGDDDEEDDDDGSRSGSGRDAGDWYDVDDGFIDDSEFQDAAEERKAKRNGFFINKGEIECEPGSLREPPHVSPVKKRAKLSTGGEGGLAQSLKLPTAVGAADIGGSPSLAAGAQGGAGGGGGEQHRSGDKKGKAFNPALLTVGPLADAIAELRAIAVQAPLPPADQKRKCMTPAMMEGLDKIKALIAVYAELPRGLTTKLLEFMDPFAGVSTLRRRLGQDRDDDAAPVAVAVPPPAPVAVAAAAPAAAALPEQAGGAAAAPKRPAPPPAQIEADIAKLRACVQARCAALLSAAAGGEPPAAGAEEDASFKWDRECEEALHTVVLNHIAAGTGKHKSAFKEVMSMEIWPAGLVDEKALKLAHTRVMKRRERAAGASGAGKRQAGQPESQAQ